MTDTISSPQGSIFQRGKIYYENGDYDQAVECFFLGVKDGDIDCQFYLGECYYYGRGVDKNLKAASEWYKKAAENGHAVAQYNLGVLYEKGLGIAADLFEAQSWYRKSAAQGNPKAKAALDKFLKF